MTTRGQAASEVLSAAPGGEVLAAECVLMLTLQRVTGRYVESDNERKVLAAEYVLMLTLVASASLHVQILQTCMPGGRCPLLTFAPRPVPRHPVAERKKERKPDLDRKKERKKESPPLIERKKERKPCLDTATPLHSWSFAPLQRPTTLNP